MQNDAAVSEIQPLEHSAIVRVCTEIVYKSVHMHQFRKYFHDCLLNIETNNCAARSCWSEKLCSRVLSCESWKFNFSCFFMFLTPKWGRRGEVGGANFGVVGKHIQIERSSDVTSQNCLHPIKLGGHLSNEPRTNAVRSTVRLQHVWQICVTHTRTRTRTRTLLWHMRPGHDLKLHPHRAMSRAWR